jgi:Putative prokaryotic signal transducing protein
MNLVHLTLAASEVEAEIICSVLRSEHIAFMQRQNLSPAAYGGAGGIEILVAETDLTRARELIGRADGG